jgi:adenylate kinase family enzyme
MSRKPKCIIITGRAESGKTTLAKKLGERLWMPVISRDEIKEGYVNTYGVKHDQLPHDTDGLVSDFFFGIVNQYLAGKISVVMEAKRCFVGQLGSACMRSILSGGRM